MSAPTTPAPADERSFVYDAQGDVVSSTDQNGTTHAFTLDALGRQTLDAVTALGAGLDGAVRARATGYDAQGNADLFTAYNAASGGSVVSQVQDTFNGFGQLTAEYRNPTGQVNTAPGGTPPLQYAYTTPSSTRSCNR